MPSPSDDTTNITYNLGTVFLNRKDENDIEYIDIKVPILISFLFISVIILVAYTFLQKEILFMIDMFLNNRSSGNKLISDLKTKINSYYLTCDNNILYAIDKTNESNKMAILYLNTNDVYSGDRCQEIVNYYV